jgi:hypothetical protein
MRVLHLIDSGFRGDRPEAGRTALAWTDLAAASAAVLQRRSAADQTVCLLGPRGALARAQDEGLVVHVAAAPALGRPEAATPFMSRLLAHEGPFDLIHCWSPEAAAAVTELVSPERLVTVSREGRPVAGGAAITFGPAAAEALGAGSGRVTVVPAPDVADRAARRRAVRAGLGLGPDEAAVLLIGGAPQADALRFGFMVNLLGYAGCGVVGLLPAWAAQVARADRFVRYTARNRIVLTERPAADLLAAADLAVFEGGGPGPTSGFPPSPAAAQWAIAYAHGAGVPAVAPEWAAAECLYPPVARGCLALNATLPELARALMGLVNEPGRRLAAAGALGGGSGGFVRAVERAWAEAAGDPAPAVTEAVAACV